MARSKQQTPVESIIFPTGVDVEGEFKFRPVEQAANRAHRIWKERQSFWIKEASVYIVALVALVFTLFGCRWVVLRSSYPAEVRQWAMTALASIITGLVGFLFGRATK